MTDDPVFPLARVPVHIGGDAAITRQEPMDGSMDWYARYGERHAADGDDGRLVSMHTFSEPWDNWEVHPHGDELVLCTAGTMTLHQERDGVTSTVVLHAGDAVVNPPGTWHTADVDGTATAVFITSGRDTDHRPRASG